MKQHNNHKAKHRYTPNLEDMMQKATDIVGRRERLLAAIAKRGIHLDSSLRLEGISIDLANELGISVGDDTGMVRIYTYEPLT